MLFGGQAAQQSRKQHNYPKWYPIPVSRGSAAHAASFKGLTNHELTTPPLPLRLGPNQNSAQVASSNKVQLEYGRPNQQCYCAYGRAVHVHARICVYFACTSRIRVSAYTRIHALVHGPFVSSRLQHANSVYN